MADGHLIARLEETPNHAGTERTRAVPALFPEHASRDGAGTLCPGVNNLLYAALIVTATLVRISGLFTDFWGDEIWSWSIARQLHSTLGVLTDAAAHIDNNHPLNTLWLYLLGANAPVWLYRLPALLAGIGAVAIAGRRSIVAGVLIGFSFPLIFYSSEARGYSPAVFFAIAAFEAMRSKRVWLFGIAASLGWLSHFTFLHVYAGAFVWTVFQFRKEPRSLLKYHLLPMLTAGMLSIMFVRHMMIGGAAPTNPWQVISQTLSLPFGGIPWVVTIGLFALSLRFNSQFALFFLTAVCLSPALTTTRELLSDHPQPLMLRYFLVCITFLLLALAPLIDSFKRMRWAICLAFMLGNAVPFVHFLRDGRGHPAAALATIAERSPAGVIDVSSDNLNRTRMLLDFYGPRSGRGFQLVEGQADWMILNHRAGEPVAGYRRVAIYPAGELSGWTWEVLQRE